MEENMKINKKVTILAIAAFILSGCFSTWKGDTAIISLNFGAGTGESRAMTVYDNLHYKIELTSAAGRIILEAQGEQTVHAEVIPGRWDIHVLATLDGEPYSTGSSLDNDIIVGQNNPVSITMERLDDGEGELTIELEVWNEDFKIEWEEDIFTVTIPPEYRVIKWMIQGIEVNSNEGNQNSLIVDTSGYTAGSYRLIVIVEKDGVPFSAELTFSVNVGGSP
jgi:hypothetical protein